MAGRGLKPGYYPLALIVFGVVGLAVFYIVSPSLTRSMLESFGIFAPSGAFLTIMEAQPILFPGGQFTLDVLWGDFTTGFLLSLISLGIIIYSVVKRAEADKTLIVVWSLIILAATLGQRRFAYYFAANVAVLTAYVSWLVLKFAGFKETVEQVDMPLKIERKSKKKKHRQKPSFQTGPVNMALGLIVVVFLVFYPNVGPMPQVGAYPAGTKMSIDIASKPAFAPSNAWCDALSWMKDNTSDPFGAPDFYYKLHKAPFTYPQTAYGVTAWWDYGYWIARIGHRLPNSNPGQANAGAVARLFIAQDEYEAAKVLDDTGYRSKYVAIDYETTTSKFYALPAWADSKLDTFYETYYKMEDGELKYATFFYPEYYRSLAVRLYNFDGKVVIPDEATVISYRERFGQDGKVYKEVIDQETFDTYEDARVYVAKQKSENYKIVGADPFISPVLLSALKDYKLVFSSKEGVRLPNQIASPQVKIFEYTGR
jgi:dolichyl-diphosphooligosaccharide--protein glycosyltransferase